MTTVVAVIVSLEIVFALWNLVSSGFAGEGSIILLAVGLVIGVGVAYTFVIELPSLRRERSLLEENPQS